MCRSLPLVVALAGCGAPPEDSELEAVFETSSAVTAVNGMALNGMALNGMAFNGLSFNGMALNGLALNGLALNGMALNGMALNGMALNGMGDPLVQDFVSYVVSCALPENDSVSYDIAGATYTFAGDLGLAPEWKLGACGEHCQRWVTACMLARLNKKGEHVQISLRGEHPALAVEPHEVQDFRTREAAYYGNLFAPRQPIFACYSPGTPTIARVCGESLAGCPMTVVGSCGQACRSGRQQSFRDCSATVPERGDHEDGDEGNHPQDPDNTISEVITVFLR
jgi:hypothetical protein